MKANVVEGESIRKTGLHRKSDINGVIRIRYTRPMLNVIVVS